MRRFNTKAIAAPYIKGLAIPYRKANAVSRFPLYMTASTKTAARTISRLICFNFSLLNSIRYRSFSSNNATRYSHTRFTEEMLRVSSVVWISLISGPMETQSRSFILLPRIPHSSPA